MKKSKPFVSIFICFGGIIFFSLIAQTFSNDKYINVLNIIQYLTIIFALYWINKDELNNMFKDFKLNYKKYIFKILLIWFIGFVLMIGANYLIDKGSPENELLAREAFNNNLVLAFINSIILAPVLEELFFRFSFNVIKNKYLFLILTSLLFAVAHLSNTNELLYLIPYGILGISFGLCYLKSNNIFSSIIVHMIHNLIVFIIIFVL